MDINVITAENIRQTLRKNLDKTIETLKNEILQLNILIKEKNNEVFIYKLYKLVEIEDVDTYIPAVIELCISDIHLNIQTDTWSIEYKHHTNEYNENDYNYHNDSDCEITPLHKITYVKFGIDKKYYIKISNTSNEFKDSRFKIYRNSKKELRVINMDYDIELDVDEQYELITNYTLNRNIPEWLALLVFKNLSDNEWSDINVISYFSEI